MNGILKMIGNLGIIPVIKIENPSDIVPLGMALIQGGLPIAEITFRTSAAEEAIKKISKEIPDLLVGAGTVLNVKQAELAIKAGAKFIVTPGINPGVIEYCLSKDILIIPGCSSPTDLETAIGYSIEVVKYFPAEAFGGINAIKALSAPYGMIEFIPTGGITPENMNTYLSYNKVLACGGSWMVKEDLIKSGSFEEITCLTRDAINRMLGFELAHVGINMEDPESSLAATKRFSDIFGIPMKEGTSSNFMGSIIEVTKKIGLGKHGHLAISTNNIERAIDYLIRNGVDLELSAAKKSETGTITAVYLKEEIGGFAVHLLQKK